MLSFATARFSVYRGLDYIFSFSPGMRWFLTMVGRRFFLVRRPSWERGVLAHGGGRGSTHNKITHHQHHDNARKATISMGLSNNQQGPGVLHYAASIYDPLVLFPNLSQASHTASVLSPETPSHGRCALIPDTLRLFYTITCKHCCLVLFGRHRTHAPRTYIV